MSKISSAQCLVKPDVKIGKRTMRFSDLFYFTPDIWRYTEALPELVSECGDKYEEAGLIISDEGIYGGLAAPQPWMPETGRRYGDAVRLHRQTVGLPDSSSVAEHVRALAEVAPKCGFSEVKILIAIRRQDTKLASGYAQVSNRVRGAGQEGFEKWVQHITRSPVGYWMGGGNKLNYFRFYSKLKEVVGSQNLFVVPFELLKKDEKEFLKKWADFMGVSTKIKSIISEIGNRKKNVRSDGKSVWALRDPLRRGPNLRPTRLFSTFGLPTSIPLRWPDFSREHEICLTEKVKEKVIEVYGKSNQNLDESVSNIDIKKYDYY